MKQELRLATLGTSAITRLMHDAIRQTSGVSCSVVCSRDAARAAEFARSVGVTESSGDFAAVLARPDVDAVYIATPNRFHTQQALQAMSYGKHVILEKPAAVTCRDAEQLIAAAQQAHVYFFEAITTLFMPNYIACKKLLPQLGACRSATIAYGQYSSKYDAYLRGENPNIFNPRLLGGALNDMGVYCVHAAVDLFGAPQAVSYTAEYGANGIDLAGTLLLSYPNFSCRIDTAKNAAMESGCQITGTNGSIQSSGALNHFGCCTAKLNGKPALNLPEPEENRMIHELARFRDAILQQDDPFFRTMCRQSLATAAILEQAHRKNHDALWQAATETA